MSVSIYDGTNDALNKIAGREDTSFWEGTQAQWDALSSSEKAEWTGKYVIITDDEDSGVFTGATSSSDGSVGYVPAPLAGDENKVLKGNGAWGDALFDSSWLSSNGDANNSIWYRRIGKMVNIRRGNTGTITLNTNTLIGVLPSGCRPPDALQVVVRSDDDAKSYVSVNANGSVFFKTTGVVNYIPPFNLSFMI